MKHMLRYQLSRMVRCREYRWAMLLSSLAVCGGFLYAVVTAASGDISAMRPPNEAASGWGYSVGWSWYSILWPFLAVLPFSTSVVEDKKGQCIAGAVSRSSYGAYLDSKLAAAFVGSATVVLLPMLLNLLMCYCVFPPSHNILYASYNGNMYSEELLGENRLYNSLPHGYLFLRLYLFSPFLYQLLYLAILGLFSGLCGASVAALSFRFSKSKLLLFVPLYALSFITLNLRTILLNLSVRTGTLFIDPYICDYLAPMASTDCSVVYFLALCLGLVLFIRGMRRWAKKNPLALIQG